jgi:hypothetical protein
MTCKHDKGQITTDDLKAELEFLSGVDGSCEMEVGVIASHFYDISASDFDQLNPSVLGAILSDSRLVVEDEDSLFELIHRRASADLSYFGLLEFIRFEFLSAECMKTAIDFISQSFDSFTFGIWSSLRTRLTLYITPPSQSGRFKPLPAIDSKIISAVPLIFSVFRGKALRLLYRGSRDGFEASAFRSRCNGHRNTVSLISSTNGCIFGGFSPVAWSSENNYVSDPSLTSFIFTLKNPHNLPAQIFKLKLAGNAICGSGSYGPTFGGGHDLHICDQSRTSNGSYSNLGHSYINKTGIAQNQVLTGAREFTVGEIEVFELI